MQKVILNENQVVQLISEGRFKVSQDSLDAPDLSFLSSVAAEFELFKDAADQFGFEVNEDILETTLKNVFTANNNKEEKTFDGAVFVIEGDYSIKPVYDLSVEGEKIQLQIFLHHKTITDRRHRALTQTLVKNKGVELLGSTDEEYLYEVVSDTAENHFFEAINRLAAGLPIYYIDFNPDGKFKIEEGGFVHKD